jgi:hypothetical protein
MPVPFHVGDPRAAVPPIGWIHATAGVATALLLLAVANPTFGAAARAWPWDLPRPVRWSPASAIVFALGAASLALLACAVLRPGRARAALALLACAVPLAALRTGSREDFLSVSTYVPPVLAGILGGALYGSLGATGSSGRGTGRATFATGAFVLAALLLYPLDAPEGAARAYAAPIVDVVTDVRHLASEAGFDGVRRYLLAPPAFLAVGYALLLAVGLLAVGMQSRVAAWVGIALAGVVSLWPLVHPYATALFSDGETAEALGLSPSTLRLRAAGDALLHYGIPAALGGFAATADLVRRRPSWASGAALPAALAPPPPPVRGPNVREDR